MIQLKETEQIVSGDKLFRNVFGRLGAMLLLAVLFAFVTIGCGDDKETDIIIEEPVKVLSFDPETYTITWEKRVQGQTFIQDYHFYVERAGRNDDDSYSCRYVGKYTSTDNRSEISVDVMEKGFCSYDDGEYIVKIASATALPSLSAIENAVATKFTCVVKIPSPIKDLRYDVETREVSWKNSPSEDKVYGYYAYIETEDRELFRKNEIVLRFIKYQDDKVILDIDKYLNYLTYTHSDGREFFTSDKYYIKIVPKANRYRYIEGDLDKAEEILIDFTYTPSPNW